MPRIGAAGGAFRKRNRNRQRQERRQFRQPLMFLFHLRGISFGAWQSHRHVVAPVEGPVIPSVWFNWPDEQVCPLGELGSHRLPHKGHIDIELRHRHLALLPESCAVHEPRSNGQVQPRLGGEST